MTGVEEANLADAVLKAKGEPVTYVNYLDTLHDVNEVKGQLLYHATTGKVVRSAFGPASDAVVDVAGIVGEALRALGYPLPVAIAKAGPGGVAERARRILIEKGVSEYDAAACKQAVRQAIDDLQNPGRRATP
jgi:hypothetical protein